LSHTQCDTIAWPTSAFDSSITPLPADPGIDTDDARRLVRERARLALRCAERRLQCFRLRDGCGARLRIAGIAARREIVEQLDVQW
jgi:hypothetical protein